MSNLFYYYFKPCKITIKSDFVTFLKNDEWCLSSKESFKDIDRHVGNHGGGRTDITHRQFYTQFSLLYSNPFEMTQNQQHLLPHFHAQVFTTTKIFPNCKWLGKLVITSSYVFVPYILRSYGEPFSSSNTFCNKKNGQGINCTITR